MNTQGERVLGERNTQGEWALGERNTQGEWALGETRTHTHRGETGMCRENETKERNVLFNRS